MMMAAHATENRRNAAFSTMMRPSTTGAPPKYSPTMAPMMLSVAPIFNAVKKYGNAVGTRTFRNTSLSLAAYERISSSVAALALVRPRTVLIMTGKNTSIATIIILLRGLVSPNQLFMMGANATIGM